MNDDTFFYIDAVEFDQDPSVYGLIMRIFVNEVTEDNIHMEQLEFEFEITQTQMGDQIRIDYIGHGNTAIDMPNFNYCAYVTDYYSNKQQFMDVEEGFKQQFVEYIQVKYGSDLQEQIDILSVM